MEVMPLFRPVKAFFATPPMPFRPLVNVDNFAFAASVARSESLICPVNTPKAEVSFGIFPLAAAAAKLVPLVTFWKAVKIPFAVLILFPSSEIAVIPLNPAKAETRAITRALFSEIIRARSASLSTTVRTASAICGRAVVAA